MFRLLRADEIDCRIATVTQYGVQLLLYKDARCDQNILDETVGPMNWQRSHTRDNANCIVSIWDEKKDQWISKEDTGTESFTEKEKGLASDSFKRACFNWGIGRELYSAPQMYVKAKDCNIEEKNGKPTCKDYFKVEEIEYIDREICYVKVQNTKKNVYIEFGTPAEAKKQYDEVAKQQITDIKAIALLNKCKAEGVAIETILKLYKVPDLESLSEKQFSNINEHWDKIKAAK